MPQNGRLREIPQKVQKLTTHRSLASGDVGRIEPALTIGGKAALWANVSTPSAEDPSEIDA